MKTDYKKYHVVRQPNQKGLKFYADRSQGKKVFDLLIERLRQKGPPYNKALVPQTVKFVPKNLERGSAAHAVYMFMLCLWMRGAVESNTTALSLKDMYEARPELFDPNLFLENGESATTEQARLIREAMLTFQLGSGINENVQGWVYNMRKLARFWHCDPRLLMNDKPEFPVLVRRLVGRTKHSKKEFDFANEDRPYGFMFFREKMVAMIAYFLMDARLVPMFFAPAPIDIHVMRILTTTQVLRVEGKTAEETIGINFLRPQAQNAARDVTEWYCRKYRISPIALCDAIWLLSSNLCKHNPGNSGYVFDPIRDRKAELKRKTGSEHPELGLEISTQAQENGADAAAKIKSRDRYMGLRWSAEEISDNPTLRRKFDRSCGRCPAEKECCFNISAAGQYNGYGLIPECFRRKPKNNQHDFLHHDEFRDTFRGEIHPEVRFTKIEMTEEDPVFSLRPDGH